MNPRLADALLYAALLLLGTWGLVSGLEMPATVASHFNAAGLADGWMPRGDYLVLMGGLLASLVVLPLGLPRLIARAPDSQLSLPNKAYWLAPERRAATLAWIAAHLRWLALLLAAFLSVLHGQVVQAQRLEPPVLTLGLAPLGVFLAAVGAWVGALWWHFQHAR